MFKETRSFHPRLNEHILIKGYLITSAFPKLLREDMCHLRQTNFRVEDLNIRV